MCVFCVVRKKENAATPRVDLYRTRILLLFLTKLQVMFRNGMTCFLILLSDDTLVCHIFLHSHFLVFGNECTLICYPLIKKFACLHKLVCKNSTDGERAEGELAAC